MKVKVTPRPKRHLLLKYIRVDHSQQETTYAELAPRLQLWHSDPGCRACPLSARVVCQNGRNAVLDEERISSS